MLDCVFGRCVGRLGRLLLGAAGSRLPLGWVAERLNAPVLKTGNGESRSWVQIPPHPFFNAEKRLGYAVQAVQIAGGCRGLRSASFVRPALVSSGSRGPKGRVGQGCFIRNREGLPWSRLDQDFRGRPRFPGVAIRSAAASRSSNCPLILIRISPSGQSETARASQSR